ncbi:MAG: peptidase, partial [Tardiphaga sp.]|nr:peptidase [Tardiphaga sp.]
MIFHHEIDKAFGYAPKPAMHQADAQKPGIDAIGQAALASHPGSVLQYISWDKDEPGTVTAFTNHAVNG